MYLFHVITNSASTTYLFILSSSCFFALSFDIKSELEELFKSNYLFDARKDYMNATKQVK